jgi:hypothetical protein
MQARTSVTAQARLTAHGVPAAVITSSLAAMTRPAVMTKSGTTSTWVPPELFRAYALHEAQDDSVFWL